LDEKGEEDMTPRRVYEDRLSNLNKKIMQMGQYAEEFIDMTIQAIVNKENYEEYADMFYKMIKELHFVN